MRLIDLVLIVALVGTNALWLVYYNERDKRDHKERQELHNRIAHPEILVNPPVRDYEELELPEDTVEYAAVGMIDPDGIKRDDNE